MYLETRAYSLQVLGSVLQENNSNVILPFQYNNLLLGRKFRYKLWNCWDIIA